MGPWPAVARKRLNQMVESQECMIQIDSVLYVALQNESKIMQGLLATSLKSVSQSAVACLGDCPRNFTCPDSKL